MTGWLDRTIFAGIKRGVESAVNEALPPLIAQKVEDHLRSEAFASLVMRIAMENPRFAFIKQMQAHYLRSVRSLTDRDAFFAARDWLNTWLSEEKVQFGDPRYDWSEEGAEILADEDVQYWETAA